MTKIIVLVLATALTALVGVAAGFAAGGKVEHALVGSIEKVDREGKTLVVKTADGAEETLKWTARTTVDGVKGATKEADLAGRKGEHVVVHYVIEGADKTAVTVKRLGRATARVAEGTVKSVGRGARDVVVKTDDGAEETFHVAEKASVDSAKGIARGSESVAKKGEHVTVYFTEEAGRKVAHLFRRL